MVEKQQSQATAKRKKGSLLLILIGVLVVLPLLGLGSATVYGAHLENNDAFCASCHTQPESTYVERANTVKTTSELPKDLAAFHADIKQPVACIQCHSGQGVPGRIDAMKLGARDLMAYVRGNYPQPTSLTHAIPDINCIKCHQNYATNQSFDNHFHVLLGRWQQFAGANAATCVDCHSSHTQDGQAKVAFLNEARTVAQCNGCHRVMAD